MIELRQIWIQVTFFPHTILKLNLGGHIMYKQRPMVKRPMFAFTPTKKNCDCGKKKKSINVPIKKW